MTSSASPARDVGDMQPPARHLREEDRTLDGLGLVGGRARIGVGEWIGAALGLHPPDALRHERGILRMDGENHAALAQRFQCVHDIHVADRVHARRAADHEGFEGNRARRAHRVDVGLRGRIAHDRAVHRHVDDRVLLGGVSAHTKRFAIGGDGLCLGHFDDGGDAPGGGGHRRAVEALMHRRGRLAGVDMRIDAAGQHEQPRRVDHTVGGANLRLRRYSDDAFALDDEVRSDDCRFRHEATAANDYPVAVRHRCHLSLLLVVVYSRFRPTGNEPTAKTPRTPRNAREIHLSHSPLGVFGVLAV